MPAANLILTGFMGTGKTTIGRLLAERCGRRFVDTDELIVARSGRSIAEIFARQGEGYFRLLESAVARQLAQEAGLVVATGGRLMLDPANAAALGPSGPVFCLQAGPEEILARLGRDLERRPLLAGPDPAGRVRRLLAERAAGYGRFTPVQTEGNSPEAVAEEILALAAGRDAPVRGGGVPDGPACLTVTYPGGQYEVLVGRGLLPSLPELASLPGRYAVVTDSHVGPLYAARCGPAATTITIPAGEGHKRLETVRAVYDELLAAGLDRQGTVVALGGGVVGDLAGFAAATFLRGVAFVQCPTSLLAMVDASVGGKVGVDLPQGKNLVGAFKQPAAVIADLDTLATLPQAEFACGLAEAIKSGLIGAPGLLAEVEMGQWDQFDVAALQSLVIQAVQVKRDVVQEDPYESGRRAWLNLGHTFGHALEQASEYTIRHGEGVAIGLIAAAHLSAALGHAPAWLQGWIEQLVRRAGLPTRVPAGLRPEAALRAMGSDKKRAGGRLRFVLLRGVGDVFVSGDVPEAAVLETLAAVAA